MLDWIYLTAEVNTSFRKFVRGFVRALHSVSGECWKIGLALAHSTHVFFMFFFFFFFFFMFFWTSIFHSVGEGCFLSCFFNVFRCSHVFFLLSQDTKKYWTPGFGRVGSSRKSKSVGWARVERGREECTFREEVVGFDARCVISLPHELWSVLEAPQTR